LFASVQNAIAWFLDGLTEIAADLVDRLNRRAPVSLVHLGEGGYALERPDGGREPAQLKLAQNDEGPQLQPQQVAQQQLGDADVDIVLPSDELLVRTLDPLPAESRQYLDGIVRHQLERFVPWRLDNVLYSYEVGPAADNDERLLVRVAATARTLHAPLIAAVNALGPRRLRMLFRGAGQAGGDTAIGLDNGARAGAQLRRLRLGIIGGLAALILLSVAGFGYLAYAWQDATDALAVADKTEADLRKQMGGRGPQETPASRDLRAILERKKAQPLTVLAIEALSTALPDDTWLTELQVADGQLRASGVSGSVADLVPAVQNSEIFADATFFSPTTRLTNGAGDRFHLQVRLVAPKAAGK
jgi:general secretion pathway protein L